MERRSDIDEGTCIEFHYVVNCWCLRSGKLAAGKKIPQGAVFTSVA